MVPVGGRAFILSHDAAKDPSQLRREIGVVFQAQSIDVKLTAAENLWHQGHLYGLHGAGLRGRVQEILARVGLTDGAKDKAETFSGGMPRRIGSTHRWAARSAGSLSPAPQFAADARER